MKNVILTLLAAIAVVTFIAGVVLAGDYGFQREKTCSASEGAVERLFICNK